MEHCFDRVAGDAQGAMPLRRIGLRRPVFDALHRWLMRAAAPVQPGAVLAVR